MIRRRTTLLLVAGALTCVTAASPARAQKGTALSLFNEGRTLATQGRYEEACDRFSRSDAMERTVGTLLNLGDCNEHLKRYATAWVAYSRAEELAQRLKDPRPKDAHEAAARVEPRLSRLVITVDTTYPGLVVARNDTKLEAAEYNAAIPVDAGPQNITVTAPGRQPWQTNVRLGEGEKQTVRVPPLEPAPVTESPPPASPLPPPPNAQPAESSRTGVALGLEIGGGVVLVGGLVFGALAIGTWASVTSICPNARCANEAVRAQHESDVHTASTFGTVSTISVAVGGAALVTGLVLHLTAPGKSVSIAPSFDRAGAGLVTTLRL